MARPVLCRSLILAAARSALSSSSLLPCYGAGPALVAPRPCAAPRLSSGGSSPSHQVQLRGSDSPLCKAGAGMLAARSALAILSSPRLTLHPLFSFQGGRRSRAASRLRTSGTAKAMPPPPLSGATGSARSSPSPLRRMARPVLCRPLILAASRSAVSSSWLLPCYRWCVLILCVVPLALGHVRLLSFAA